MKQTHKKLKTVLRLVLVALAAAVIGVNIYALNASLISGDSVPMPFGVGAAVLCARLPVIILTCIMLGGEIFTLPVQLAPDFLSCPYPMTVLGAELLRMSVYFLCGLALVYAMLAASALFRGYAPPFVCGAAIVLASYLASSIHYYNPGTVPQYLNLVTLMGCKKLFTSLVGVKMPIFF